MKHELIAAFLKAQEQMRGKRLADKVRLGMKPETLSRIVTNAPQNYQELEEQKSTENGGKV